MKTNKNYKIEIEINYKIEIEIKKNDSSEDLKKESFNVLEKFKNDLNSKNIRRESDIVSIIKTKQGAENHEKDKCFNQDAIRMAIPHIQEAGYFVWYHKDYKGQTAYWITTRENQPHVWYSLVK